MDGSKPQDASGSAEEWHPRPSYRRLALHHWEMGQVLHPAQFRAQEAALLEHVGLRAQLSGLPGYGVAFLPWSDDQLAGGDLNISALTVVLPSGLLIDYPGNAVLNARNLATPPKVPGPVPIYLHVRGERRDDGAHELVSYEDDAREIRRAIYQVEISAAPGIENGQESMKLAELTFSAGVWALTPYVPPLLRLGKSVTPFLRTTLEKVVTAVIGLESELVKRAADCLAGAEQLSDVRRVLAAVYRVRAVLADHGYGVASQTVALHPYHLFAALRAFYLEAVVPQGASLEVWPQATGAPGTAAAWSLRYQHDDPRGCFEQLARGLTRGTAVPPAVAAQRLMFQRDDYWFVTPPFPDELRRAGEVFLLLERDPQVPVQAGEAAPSLDAIKLASPLRIEEVHEKALEGVPRFSIPSLGFERTFGHRATVFQLETKGPEWHQAVIESALCFAVQSGLEHFSAYLLWQSPGHG